MALSLGILYIPYKDLKLLNDDMQGFIIQKPAGGNNNLLLQ